MTKTCCSEWGKFGKGLEKDLAGRKQEFPKSSACSGLERRLVSQSRDVRGPSASDRG